MYVFCRRINVKGHHRRHKEFYRTKTITNTRRRLRNAVSTQSELQAENELLLTRLVCMQSELRCVEPDTVADIFRRHILKYRPEWSSFLFARAFSGDGRPFKVNFDARNPNHWYCRYLPYEIKCHGMRQNILREVDFKLCLC